ncbi:helix-turn-helix domain-containing protein [Photorhabdus bodei]|uniref:Helix-turn-helix domain-containing protein n=1 Tax=Photorhabdus bodei TaxID=2029681 RepID=A0AAW6BQ77_9GAMM|nr:helix-turn-helix domain-containing protein [Photorhabdus bodei]MDB6374911.1 helix-turn-helix domain-containing protein [Photorhabdus bodei]
MNVAYKNTLVNTFACFYTHKVIFNGSFFKSLMVGFMAEKHSEETKNTDHTFHESGITRFGERLSTLIGRESYKSFAKKCDMSDKAIRDYVSGKTYPALDRIAHIAKVTGCSFEWLTTGHDLNKNEPEFSKITEVNTMVTPEQQQAWLAILSRMKPEEREVVIDRVFRQGISALLTPPQTDIQQESQFPWPEDLPAKLGVSNHSLVFAQLYASLTDEQRQRFLESINDKEHIPANHNKMSSKAG